MSTAVLSVSAEPHTGCGKFVERFGVDALKFVNSPQGRALNLRGINARVIVPGVLRPGDAIRKFTATSAAAETDRTVLFRWHTASRSSPVPRRRSTYCCAAFRANGSARTRAETPGARSTSPGI